MKIRLKSPIVNLDGLTQEMLQALLKACIIWRQHGCETIMITSATDGQHMAHSRHYKGDALDLRSRDLPDSIGMADQLRDSLSDEYDVILETDHIHVEFDPKV